MVHPHLTSIFIAEPLVIVLPLLHRCLASPTISTHFQQIGNRFRNSQNALAGPRAPPFLRVFPAIHGWKFRRKSDVEYLSPLLLGKC